MQAIPTQAIDGARRHLESLLTQTCSITTGGTTKGASGATKKVAGTPRTGVPCRVELRDQEPDGRVQTSERERFEDAAWVVYLAHDTEVHTLDTIAVDGAPSPALTVVGVSDRIADPFLLQAYAKERD